jgi:polyphosphate kinase 2 (PPK2 family)
VPSEAARRRPTLGRGLAVGARPSSKARHVNRGGQPRIAGLESRAGLEADGQEVVQVGREKRVEKAASVAARNGSSDGAAADAKLKPNTLACAEFDRELRKLQRELVIMQEYVKANGLKIVVIFEGRDAAGKGGVIKRIAERTNPRVCRVVALPAPTEREKTQWYFQRYVAHLPAAGEIVLFDRSWYNRAGVARVMGYCTEQEYEESQPGRAPARFLASGGIRTVMPSLSRRSIWTWCQ